MSDSVTWVTCATASCGYSPFPVDSDFNKRARRTHESFYCPAGHSNYYPQKSDIERLEDENRRLRQRLENWKSHYERAWAEARTCPWPTCREYVYSSRDSLYDHMRRAHDMPTLALVREAS